MLKKTNYIWQLIWNSQFSKFMDKFVFVYCQFKIIMTLFYYTETEISIEAPFSL